jgi:hypothetical protein
MAAWEYLTLHVMSGVTESFYLEGPRYTGVGQLSERQILDQLGADGWELVNVLTDDEGGRRLYFKRARSEVIAELLPDYIAEGGSSMPDQREPVSAGPAIGFGDSPRRRDEEPDPSFYLG